MIEVGDLVTVSSEDDVPWRVIAYDVDIEEAVDIANNYDYPNMKISGIASEQTRRFAVLSYLAQTILVVPTSQVREPHNSAWYIASPQTVKVKCDDGELRCVNINDLGVDDVNDDGTVSWPLG